MKHAMAKPKKSWKERLRIFLLVLCSVVFVVSAGMLVYYLLWEPYQHNQKSVEIQQIYPTRGYYILGGSKQRGNPVKI